MKKSLFIPLSIIISMWILFIVQFIYNIDLNHFALQPRKTETLFCILTSPLIHGSWEHLLSNTPPLLLLSLVLYLSYEKIATRIWLMNYILPGILVWLFGRDAYHIGASGLVYGLAAFLLFSGFFRMDVKAIAIASIIALFYGSMVWGLLPLEEGISWESHLSGVTIGCILSFFYRNQLKDKLVIDYETTESNKKSFDDFLRQ